MRLLSLAIAACLLTLLSGCEKPVVGVRFDRQLSSFVPARSVALGGLELHSFQKSSLYQRHAGEIQLPMLDAAVQSLGFDPRHDVESLLLAFDSRSKLTALGRGTFRADAVTERLVSHGARQTAYRGQQLLMSPDVAIFFPKQGLAVAGPANDIYSAIDSLETKTAGIPESLRQLGEQLPSSAQFWFLSRDGLTLGRLATRSDANSILTSFASYVKEIAAGMTLDDGLHLDARLACGSDAGAQQVRDAAKGVIGFARLSTNDTKRGLLQVFDAVKVEQTGSAVRIRADLSGELADSLIREYGSLLVNRQPLAR